MRRTGHSYPGVDRHATALPLGRDEAEMDAQ